MEVLITACWHIWLIRNAAVFNNERPLFRRWKAGFTNDIFLLQHRIKRKFRDSLLTWLAALP
jgi:hypothetical protein